MRSTANEDAFELLFAYLDSQDAPAEVRSALEGLELRYQIGRRLNDERMEGVRAMKEELARLREAARGNR